MANFLGFTVRKTELSSKLMTMSEGLAEMAHIVSYSYTLGQEVIQSLSVYRNIIDSIIAQHKDKHADNIATNDTGLD